MLRLHPGVLHGSCCAKYAAAFLRNSFHRGDFLEGVPQLLRPSAQPLEDALPILCFIVRGPWVLVGHAVPQSIVKEHSQFARRRILAARLAERRVVVLKSFPPEILLSGAKWCIRQVYAAFGSAAMPA